MFKYPVIAQELSQNGFAVLDANLVAEVRQLKEYINSRFSIPSSEFYYSLLENTYEQNKELRDFIKKTLQGFYERYFENYRTVTESFLAKPANTPGEFLLHQDWCYTDERQYAAYNIWMPLADVNEDNGAMIFLSGSHRWFNNLRSSTLPTARIRSKYFSEQGVKAITLRKGQALIFHPAVFHGSCPNLSSQNRIVATATIMPANASFLYFQQHNKNEVKAMHLDDDIFLRDLKILAPGGEAGVADENTIPYIYHTITEAELIEKFLSQKR
jgi:hypothetical protein